MHQQHISAPGGRGLNHRRRHVDGQRHGPYVAYWPSGQRFAEGAWLDDAPYFHWRYWYESGQLMAEGEYDHGVRVLGTWTYFTEDGAPATEAEVF